MALRQRWAVLASTVAVSAVLAVPSGVRAYRAYRDQNARTTHADYVRVPNTDGDLWLEMPAPQPYVAEEGEGESDDPRRRMMHKYRFGRPHPQYAAEKMRIAHEEAQRWSHLLPSAPRTAGDVDQNAVRAREEAEPIVAPVGGAGPALSWVNIGPTDAAFQWNGTTYLEVDSGRSSGVAVDPRDPTNTVYLATSGGGVWKTFNFSATNPTWHPITEGLGNIAVGAMAMDPSAPDTLYVGIGDAFDLAGGQVVKTTNGGVSWSTPVNLTGTYPSGAGSLAVRGETIRAVKVDATNPSTVLVSTEVGLFRSTNSGASFALVDLPNSGATQVAESVWSIEYLGSTGGASRFVASGVYACRQGVPPPPPGWGVTAGSADPVNGGTCTVGNLGDIWYSADGGATWTSSRAAGGMTAMTAVGRMSLGAGGPKANPATTVVYAQAGNTGDTAGAGVFRSTNGGQTWTAVTGTVSNGTTTSTNCTNTNNIGVQAWYNQAIGVDPANDANVLIGGIYCGLRTINGTAGTVTWQNVSHWLPTGGGGQTAQGRLPYVHADWHRSQIVTIGAVTRAFAGTDGGLFVSDNLFTAASGAAVVWRSPNRGIVTHLSYSVASGDPASGNPFVAFTGMQDNGTRFRDSSAAPTTFNQVIGGDGIGTSANRATNGTSMYWAGVNGEVAFCVPSAANNQCNQGGAWTRPGNPSLARCRGTTDAIPFVVEYAVSLPSTVNHTFLTRSNYGVYKATGTTGNWTSIGDCFEVTTGTFNTVQGLGASEKFDGVYGAAISGGRFAITTNCAGATTNCAWSFTSPMGTDLNGNGTLENNERILGAASIAFAPSGTPGQEFVGVSVATNIADNSGPITTQLGHIYKTTNGGTTWTRANGHGGPSPLPPVVINVVRYDTSDLTNNTIYVGTDLGVYWTQDGGATWARFGYGLPLVRINDMFVGRNGQILRVGTYGRGLWEIYPAATAERGLAGDGDYDRNQQIDIVDLAASASRLGTNPTTTAQPLYDWNMDVLGAPTSTALIEDSDLNAVISKFGARP